MVSKYFVSASGTGDEQVTEGGVNVTGYNLRLMGFTVQDDGATVSKVVFRNGTGTGNDGVAGAYIAANASDAQWFGPLGVHCPNGIFIDRTAGTTTVTVFYAKA